MVKLNKIWMTQTAYCSPYAIRDKEWERVETKSVSFVDHYYLLCHLSTSQPSFIWQEKKLFNAHLCILFLILNLLQFTASVFFSLANIYRYICMHCSLVWKRFRLTFKILLFKFSFDFAYDSFKFNDHFSSNSIFKN